MTPCLIIIRCHQELTVINPYYHCSRMLNYHKFTMINPVSLINLIKDLKITIFLWFSYGFPMVFPWFCSASASANHCPGITIPHVQVTVRSIQPHVPGIKGAILQRRYDGHRDRDRLVFTRCLVCKGSCWVVNHYCYDIMAQLRVFLFLQWASFMIYSYRSDNSIYNC